MNSNIPNALDLQDWMTAAPVKRLFQVLGAPAVDARFVGGCVRNAVMGIAVGEIDVATPEEPEVVIERLSKSGVKCAPTGIAHGTVTAIVDGVPFEVTSLRKDTACDGRHAAVEFTADWHEDSRRRDFTFNAMSMRPNGELFDDHGGLEDARAGRVRFVGDPADRIREDYLRILRLFRFYAWYGREPLEAATLQACRDHAAGLDRLSGERLQQEMSKLLSAPSPLEAVAAMFGCGVMQRVLPDAENESRLAALLKLETEAPDFPPDWLRRLASLLPAPALKPAVKYVSERFKFSNASAARLKALLQTLEEADPAQQDFRWQLYKCGAALAVDRALLGWAARNRAKDEGLRARIEAARAWKEQALPVSGDDVLALGVAAGPDVGRWLAEAERLWVTSNFALDREAILKELAAGLKRAASQT